ncbi:hypothetical protein [Amycolatopsis antarctica]|uniref:hypothetical protein n=1 Tax=Amycolatopsis antarctica TaxID=1854586 RepID=UPI0013FDF6B2|nr:hypothetical protein [Amycolatopsis antarctica]
MATVMHINKTVFGWSRPTGSVITYCGARLRSGEGAPRHAPLCQACARKAGWSKDRRH